MSHGAAIILILLILGYATAGALFAIAFVAAGISKVDARAAGATWGFRLLVLPGSALFWPLLLRRWMTAPPASQPGGRA